MKTRGGLLMSAALLLSMGRANGTTVLAVIDPNTILIAADSKTVDENERTVGTVCKIGFANNFYWGILGLSQFREPHLSISFEIVHAMAPQGDIDTRMTAFSDRVSLILTSIMNRINHAEPGRYRRTYEGQYATIVVFAGFEGASP